MAGVLLSDWGGEGMKSQGITGWQRAVMAVLEMQE